MGPKNNRDGQKRSFIEQARREQIIEAAIDTIAELGYVKSSLARIAERAGISKGVISYHFAGKDELLERVVERIYLAAAEHIASRVTEHSGDPVAMLRVHILSAAEHMSQRRKQLLALHEIFAGMRDPNGEQHYWLAGNEPIYQGLESYFALGQRQGVFRRFDGRMMAVTVQAAIDEGFGYWTAHPDHDLLAHFAELAEVFDRAVRADPT